MAIRVLWRSLAGGIILTRQYGDCWCGHWPFQKSDGPKEYLYVLRVQSHVHNYRSNRQFICSSLLDTRRTPHTLLLGDSRLFRRPHPTRNHIQPRQFLHLARCSRRWEWVSRRYSPSWLDSTRDRELGRRLGVTRKFFPQRSHQTSSPS